MQNKISIITDTGSDQLDELVKLGVDYVPLYITFDGKTYIKQMKDITIEEFYKKLTDPNTPHPKTSLPSVMDYVEIFNKHLDNNEDILYLSLNSKFSGAYQSSLSARDIILEERPDAKIVIVDTLAVTFTLASIIKEAVKLRDKGMSIDEIASKIDEIKNSGRVFLTVDSLDNLKESGRLSNLSAALAGLLNIKPIIHFQDGILSAKGKVKGMNKALAKVIEDAKEYVGDNDINDYNISMIYAANDKEVQDFSEIVKEKFKPNTLEFCKLGICIGVHAGPTTLGIAFMKKVK